MSRPLICQLVHTLNIGGAEILAANLARKLRDRFDFMFICLDEAGVQCEQLQSEGFQVEVLNRRAGVDWHAMKRLAAICKGRKVQVIHAHQYTPFFYSAACGLFCRRPAVLFTEHGRWHPDLPSRKRKLFNRLMIRRRDRVVAVGEHVRQALIRNEGISADRVGVIYNGISLTDFKKGPERDEVRRQVRAELGLDDSTPVVLQVARLDKLKDHLTAIKAMLDVRRKLPDAVLLLAGDGPERNAITSSIAEHGIDNSVKLLGTRTDVSRLLVAADVFLLTSISEGIPLTVLEAMATMLPVVATAVGGIPEIVIDGQTGNLVPPREHSQVAAAIVELIENRSLCHSMGKAGRCRVENHFSDQEMNVRYLRQYEDILCG